MMFRFIFADPWGAGKRGRMPQGIVFLEEDVSLKD
jgi:hypothetical protein